MVGRLWLGITDRNKSSFCKQTDGDMFARGVFSIKCRLEWFFFLFFLFVGGLGEEKGIPWWKTGPKICRDSRGKRLQRQGAAVAWWWKQNSLCACSFLCSFCVPCCTSLAYSLLQNKISYPIKLLLIFCISPSFCFRLRYNFCSAVKVTCSSVTAPCVASIRLPRSMPW